MIENRTVQEAQSRDSRGRFVEAEKNALGHAGTQRQDPGSGSGCSRPYPTA